MQIKSIALLSSYFFAFFLCPYSSLMSLSISTSSRNLWATISRASFGHAWNQSMVQQLIREGNILRRFLNASPIGLMAVEYNNSWLHLLTRTSIINRARNSAYLAQCEGSSSHGQWRSCTLRAEWHQSFCPQYEQFHALSLWCQHVHQQQRC